MFIIKTPLYEILGRYHKFKIYFSFYQYNRINLLIILLILSVYITFFIRLFPTNF